MSTWFASDLHLASDDADSARAFLAWLEQGVSDADVLYLLGDLFETWVGDDDPDPFHESICAALRSRARRVPLFVMRGNRDFLFGSGFERRSGARLLEDPAIVELDGQPTLLTHGDLLCTDDLPYQELRSIVRNPAWQRRVLSLPLRTRVELAETARAGSRRHTSAQAARIMDVDERTVERVARATGVARIVHGHTHRPAIHRSIVDERPLVRAVLGAWYEHGTAIELRDGELRLHEIARN